MWFKNIVTGQIVNPPTEHVQWFNRVALWEECEPPQQQKPPRKRKTLTPPVEEE